VAAVTNSVTQTSEIKFPLFNPATDGWDSGAWETALAGPPGTGKTTAVLDSWLCPALKEVEPINILACSFSKSAALVLRNRLSLATGIPDFRLLRCCSTIHSEAYRLLREDRNAIVWKDSMRRPGRHIAVRETAIGEEEEIIIGEEYDQGWDALGQKRSDLFKEAKRFWALMCNRWPEERLSMDPDDPSLVHLVSRTLNYTESDFPANEIAAEIRCYTAEKHAAGAIDFTDMLAFALAIPAPSRALVLVDEAQDLSPLQILLIQKWAEAAERLVWVGDPDQGIYEFAGATGEHLTSLLREGLAPDSRVLARGLQRSHRVPATAHRYARAVILQNRQRVDVPYLPRDDEPGQVIHLRSVEAAVALAETHMRLGVPGEKHEIFILSRTRRGLGAYATALEQAGIPFRNERGSSPLGQRVLLRTMTCLHDILARRLVSQDQLAALVKSIPARVRKAKEAKSARHPFLLGTKKAAEDAIKGLEDGSYVRQDGLHELGLNPGAITSLGTLEAALEAIRKLEESRPLLLVLERQGINALRIEHNPPAIVLTTMHAAKGREAGTVIVDLDAPYPVKLAIQTGNTEQLESERRVLYVALTRTLHTLALVPGYLDRLIPAVN